MAHYIITGGCGFLGTWIVKQLLDEGHDVTVFDLQKVTKRWEMILTPDEIAKEHRLSLNSGRSRHVVAIGPVCPIAATLAGLGSRSFARHCNFQWPKALRMRPCGDNAFSYGIVGDSLLAKIQRTGRWCGP